jgi:hypothetical protein
MIVHVWREILKRNLSPYDICRLAQTCKLLNRLCKERSVWSPFGGWFHKERIFAAWNAVEDDMMKACHLWFFPLAKSIRFASSLCKLTHVSFTYGDRDYCFKRKDGWFVLSISDFPRQNSRFRALHFRGSPVEFNIKQFWRIALNERCTPQWMWENNPLVKHAAENGVLLL